MYAQPPAQGERLWAGIGGLHPHFAIVNKLLINSAATGWSHMRGGCTPQKGLPDLSAQNMDFS